MPRSYSFDHFQTPKREPHMIWDHEKKAYVESTTENAEAKIHYGKAHAETEEILTARRMNKQLEELAGIEEEAPAEADAQEALPEVDDGAAEQKVAQLRKEMPIGALQAEAEAPAEDAFLREVMDRATANLKLVRTAAGDLAVAGLRLARLPLDVAQLAAKRIKPRNA